MTSLIMSREIGASQVRFQRTLGVSLLVHALLFGWLLMRDNIRSVNEGIVEVTWLEPAPPLPPPLAVETKPRPQPQTRAETQPEPARKFLRREVASETEPSPQLQSANRDLVKQRLEALRSSRVDGALTSQPSSERLLAASAPVPDAVPRGSGAELKREETNNAPAAELRRGKTPAPRRLSAAEVAVDAPVAAAGATDFDRTARRSLAGAELVGEVADRPVLSHAVPDYPEWAKDQAVEGTVTLLFTVLADGTVKESIQVERTAGFADFDDNAVAALRRWRFAPLTDGSSAEQRGAITFRYRLRD